MTEISPTWSQIRPNLSPSAVEDITTKLIDFGLLLPFGEAPSTTDDPQQNRQPTNKSEVVDMLTYLLAAQDWLNGETHPVLDEILSICGQLAINHRDEHLWRDLDALNHNRSRAQFPRTK